MLFLFSKFKGRKWIKYSAKKRYKILVALEKKVAKSLKIEPLELVIREDEKWNCYGSFAVGGDKKLIYINSKLLTVPELKVRIL